MSFLPDTNYNRWGVTSICRYFNVAIIVLISLFFFLIP